MQGAKYSVASLGSRQLKHYLKQMSPNSGSEFQLVCKVLLHLSVG